MTLNVDSLLRLGFTPEAAKELMQKAANSPYIEDMPDQPTRNEVSHQIEAVEARLDAKIADIRADVKIMSAAAASMQNSVSELSKEVKRIEDSVKSSGRWTIATVITTVLGGLAVAVGIGALVVTSLQNATG